MKIKPVITNRIQTKHTSYDVDFELVQNITFIAGDSGVGKTAVFSFLQELAAEDKRIKCFNFLDQNKGYKQAIKNSKNKLVVIDNADLLLNDEFRLFISKDMNNQYIIFGRNPSGLLLQADEIFELKSETKEGRTRFYIGYAFG
ncbi:hypothetical protein [[Clostridium] aminophilum]|uniref:AAA domain-containing protein n=1 Tax=[Clostridium] aminophilum TaxID=1526 RepID=A0A1I6IUX5_9FIRM|nr:hypothetical protein [[Clostridium] aminophilum]SFR70562.1 hypothetical protein SAMN02910262_00899 [[Clostridium] aminophilum]